MNFNWGTGIALFYGVFALSMIGMALSSRKHPPLLVQKNYYDLDLNYQARLEQKQNAAALTVLPQVQYDDAAQMARIIFPKDMKVERGTAKFYRPSTTDDDFTASIENIFVLEVPTSKLASGKWLIDLYWEAEGKKYFFETSFYR